MTDYISREAAIAEIEEWHDMYSDSDAAREALSLAKRAIRKIPSADVRPVVKAAWEDTPNPQWPAYDIRHCPCCGWSIPKSKLRAKDLDWNYCPNCGADMKEES